VEKPKKKTPNDGPRRERENRKRELKPKGMVSLFRKMTLKSADSMEPKGTGTGKSLLGQLAFKDRGGKTRSEKL